MAELLWEWKPRFAVALVVRGLLNVTSHSCFNITNCPVVMRRYANANGDEQRYKTSKTQAFFAFYKMVIVVEQNLTTYTVCTVVVATVIRHSTLYAGRDRRGRLMAGTTRAVPDSSTNHSSAHRIVVNSYNLQSLFLNTNDRNILSQKQYTL